MNNICFSFKALLLFILAFTVTGCAEYKAKVIDVQTGVETKDAEIFKRETTVNIHYPADDLVTEKQEIGVIAAVVPGGPLTAVTVSVNGNQVKKLEMIMPGDRLQQSVPVEAVAPLKIGKNYISVTVYTVSGERFAKTITVNRTESSHIISSKPVIRRWAVVVGISEYLHAERGIQPLQFAHKDAAEFMDFLHSPHGGGFDPTYTRLLLNEEATTRNIRSALYTFLKQAGEEDLVIIYFAGHGAPEPGRPDNLYLISYDTVPDDLASTAFPMWEMETALKRYIVAERVVILADACHSGGIGGEVGLRGVGNANMINTYLANLEGTKPGRAIITASEANQLSCEGDQWDGHGVFTYFLLKGLKGEADADQKGVITISEAFNYVYNKVRRATSSQQHPNIQGRFDRSLPLAVSK